MMRRSLLAVPVCLLALAIVAAPAHAEDSAAVRCALVEIGILVIAQHWDANYVRQAHIKAGKAAGLSDAIIDAVLAGREPELADPHERAVHRFAAALVAGAKLGDAEFAEVEQVLGRDGIAEVLVLLGYYTSVALAMKVHDVPVPAST